MTRASDRKPSPGPRAGHGRGDGAKPGRSSANAEIFGRFVSTLARLEGNSGRTVSGKERGR